MLEVHGAEGGRQGSNPGSAPLWPWGSLSFLIHPGGENGAACLRLSLAWARSGWDVVPSPPHTGSQPLLSGDSGRIQKEKVCWLSQPPATVPSTWVSEFLMGP